MAQILYGTIFWVNINGLCIVLIPSTDTRLYNIYIYKSHHFIYTKFKKTLIVTHTHMCMRLSCKMLYYIFYKSLLILMTMHVNINTVTKIVWLKINSN